jgi:hypothetical protein
MTFRNDMKHFRFQHVLRFRHRVMFTSRPRQPLLARMLPTRQLHTIGRRLQSRLINVRCPAGMSGNSSLVMWPRLKEATSTLVLTKPAPRSHQVTPIHISRSPLLTPDTFVSI